MNDPVELNDARRVLEAAFARGWLDDEQRDTAQKVLHRLAKALTAPAGEAELVVAEDGAGFALAEGNWVDLTRRRPLRRLLAALLEVRRAGATATKQDLIAAGWPGERLLPDAAANRLHVALSELRKLGLARAIVHQGDGWTLDPAVAIEVSRSAVPVERPVAVRYAAPAASHEAVVSM